MDDLVILFFSIENVYHISIGDLEVPFITHLSPALRVEGCLVKDQLELCSFFLAGDFAVFDELNLCLQLIVSEEFLSSIFLYNLPIVLGDL